MENQIIKLEIPESKKGDLQYLTEVKVELFSWCKSSSFIESVDYNNLTISSNSKKDALNYIKKLIGDNVNEEKDTFTLREDFKRYGYNLKEPSCYSECLIDITWGVWGFGIIPHFNLFQYIQKMYVELNITEEVWICSKDSIDIESFEEVFGKKIKLILINSSCPSILEEINTQMYTKELKHPVYMRGVEDHMAYFSKCLYIKYSGYGIVSEDEEENKKYKKVFQDWIKCTKQEDCKILQKNFKILNKKNLVSFFKTKRDEIQSEILDIDVEIEKLYKEVVSKLNLKKKLIQDNKVTRNVYNSGFVSTYKSISDLSEMADVKYVIVEKGYLKIYTNKLYFMYHTNRHLLGEMEIQISMDSGNVKIFNTSRTVKAYGNQSMQAPHVFEEGQMCMGNLAQYLPDLISKQDYLSAGMMIINFLQSCNLEDDAGWFGFRWPQVNAENNIMYDFTGDSSSAPWYKCRRDCSSCDSNSECYDAGYTEEESEGYYCESCGDRISDDNYCNHCERCEGCCTCLVCENCGDRFSEDDETFCHECNRCKSCCTCEEDEEENEEEEN